MSLKIGSWFTTQQNAAQLSQEIAEPQSPQKITPGEAIPVDIKKTNSKIEKIFNTVISKLSTTLTQIKEKTISLFSAVRIQLTDTKIKQIFLGAISGYSLIGARVIAGGSIPLTISSFAAATPFVGISGGLLWYSFSLIDYENPSTLHEIRNQTRDLPLPEIVKKHGWKNLFQFKLLDHQSFNNAYRAYASTLSFSEILVLYKQASRQLKLVESPQTPSSIIIPTPSEWKQKFFTETTGLTPRKIIEEFEIADLKSFEILSPDQITLLEKNQELLFQETIANYNFYKEIDTFLSNLHKDSLDKLNEAKEALNKAETFERDIRIVRFSSQSHLESRGKSDLVDLYTTGRLTDLIPNIDDACKTALSEGHTNYKTRKEEIDAEAKKIELSYVKTLTRSAPNKA